MFENFQEVREKQQEESLLFFNEGVMSFWRCQIESELYDGRYFISSEQPLTDRQRAYTVREVKGDGRVVPASQFMEYQTKDEAKELINELLAKDE